MGPILTEQDLTDMFDDYLDDFGGEIEVAGSTFSTSQIIKACDPIRYRIDRDGYADMLVSEGYAIEGY